jgi:hypothetical protein
VIEYLYYSEGLRMAQKKRFSSTQIPAVTLGFSREFLNNEEHSTKNPFYAEIQFVHPKVSPSRAKDWIDPFRDFQEELWKEVTKSLPYEKLGWKCNNNSKGQEELGPITA